MLCPLTANRREFHQYILYSQSPPTPLISFTSSSYVCPYFMNTNNSLTLNFKKDFALITNLTINIIRRKSPLSQRLALIISRIVVKVVEAALELSR